MFEQDASEMSIALDTEQWGEALAIVHRYRSRALAITDDRIADLTGDIARQRWWRSIRSKTVQIMGSEARSAER